MAKAFRCRVITPEARLLDEEVSAVNVPMWDGQMGFLNQRAPIVGKLGTGELRLDFTGGGERTYFLDGGFAQMVDNRLTILANEAVPAEQINETEAKAELAEAQARQSSDPKEMERITHERTKARTKIEVAQRFKAKGGRI
ncbi:MAG: ATP synthase F1 subunit epsilon [Phycisphaeraceae bacterium]|nr:ATP synthase F1 subunit epsilon [Phycisphaeraceae bacterium]